jgi:23S rRNA pseudouridine2605 synthase
MKSDPNGGATDDAQQTLFADSATAPNEEKPKARKKKAATTVETAIPEAATDAPAEEPVKARPARKAAKKAAKQVEAADPDPEPEAEAAEPAPVKAAAEAAEELPKVTSKKSARKKRAAGEDKGRDLVTQEPGAKEVAEVLHEAAVDVAEARPVAEKAPEVKLERLQKILAKAGIASRRAAEEMILGGRVQINGQVVLALGTKADPARDHVRVDGKLLAGAERIRYFVLNKPKGYVTTVSDPEGRPTVMQFFAGERERLYPVGRLDYLSEGLLLVTNDGELANKLTKASSGVEKTYLVKVSGQPSEEMLDTLRQGVVIERGRPGTGSGRVRTAPAQIRQVREGENPWYEVIVIEGRNRELRKMFEEIGHHVEKIRRVGYGPLILDLEPGKQRELEPEEVHALRLASEGKLKTRRRRGPAPAQLPTVAGRTVRYKKADGKPGFAPRARRDAAPELRAGPKPPFRRDTKPVDRRELRAGDKPVLGGRGDFAGKPRRVEPPVTDYVLPPRKAGPPDDFDERPVRQKPDFNPDYKPGFRTGGKPATRANARPDARPSSRPDTRTGPRPAFREDRPPKRFGSGAPPRGAGKPFRPAKPEGGFVRRERPVVDDSDFPPAKTPGFRIEPVVDAPREERPRGGRPFHPAAGRPAGGDRPFRSPAGKPPFRPRSDRPDRPVRAEGRGPAAGSARAFRAGGKPSGRFASERPGPERTSSERPERSGKFERPPAGRTPRAFVPREGTSPRRPKPFGAAEDRPREFRPRTGSAKPRTSADARPASPAGGKGRTGPGGEPRVKERWRNSFTGKNKGRPKPKPRKSE